MVDRFSVKTKICFWNPSSIIINHPAAIVYMLEKLAWSLDNNALKLS